MYMGLDNRVDGYVAAMDNARLNETMRTLTAKSTILKVRGLVAGISDMNLERMSKLRSIRGFPTSPVTMIMGVLVPIFRHQGW